MGGELSTKQWTTVAEVADSSLPEGEQGEILMKLAELTGFSFYSYTPVLVGLAVGCWVPVVLLDSWQPGTD